MRKICSVCEGKKYVLAPGVHILWFTLFKHLWFKKPCPTCLAKGFINAPPSATDQIRSWPKPVQQICNLCDGTEQVLQVMATTHSPDVGSIREVVFEDMDLCVGCRRKLRANLLRFRAAIINREMLPAGSYLPNVPADKVT